LSELNPRKGSELVFLDKICERVRSTGQITDEELIELSATFGIRVKNAIHALQKGRVKKYVFKPSGRVVWIVVGKEKDYQIIPGANFCTCDDFYFRVMNREVHLCYHIIAQKLAEATGTYEEFEETDDLYETLMREWRESTKK